MTFTRKSGGTNVNVTAIKIRQGNTWVTPQTVKRRIAGTWATCWTSFNVTKNGDAGAYFYREEPAPFSRAMTANTSVTITGSGPHTISWVRISANNGVTINTTTAASVRFSATVSKNVPKQETWRCTVTDTPSGQTKYVDVIVTFEYVTDA